MTHAFTAAIAARDVEALIGTLAPDVVLHSAVTRVPLAGREVWGADRLRLDADGQVSEITVLGRPMAGVATFLTEIGPRLARRRRGGLVAKLLRYSALPLPPMLGSLDPVSRWILRQS